MGMSIEIIDNTTGRPPSAKLIDRIAKEYGLRHDIDQFAVTEDGHLIILDDCGNFCYVDRNGFDLRISFSEVKDGNIN